ncbi:MAG: hypothetical protein IJ356_06770 [Erysipelotrichaceae bacterium]|nr:hypothetical protein [Erysipelotrichaceae bacterium]
MMTKSKLCFSAVLVLFSLIFLYLFKENVIDPYLFYTEEGDKILNVVVYDRHKDEIVDNSTMIVSIKDDVTITYQDTVCVIPIQDDLVGFPSVGPYPCFNDENIEWKVYFGKGLEEIVIQNAKVSTISESGWGWYEHSQYFHVATREKLNNKDILKKIMNKVFQYQYFKSVDIHRFFLS